MTKCDCGNLVEDERIMDPGEYIPILKGLGLKTCSRCALNDFSEKRVALIKKYIESLNIQYTAPTYKIIKTLSNKEELKIGSFYLLGEKELHYYAGYENEMHWFVPLDLSKGYIVDGLNVKDEDIEIPKEFLPPQELIDYVRSRPSMHLTGPLLNMFIRKNAIKLIELTSNWSNDFTGDLKIGTYTPKKEEPNKVENIIKLIKEKFKLTDEEWENESIKVAVISFLEEKISSSEAEAEIAKIRKGV